jgi:hypothetical protein
MEQSVSSSAERHLAVDLHKHYLVIGGVNARQEVVLPPRRVDLGEWPTWAKTNLKPSDVLVVEATTNTWWFYDQTYPFVGQLLVADPRKIAWIAQTRVKTDAHDVMKLARLSAAGLIPLVWVPPLAVRELRALLAHRRRLVRTQTVLKNRLHSLLHRLQIASPAGDPFCAKHRAWWDALKVSPTGRLHVRHDLATLEQVVEQLEEIDDELRRLSCNEPWSDVMPYLLHLPGVGLIVAMTILAAIGDITRFPTSKKLVGYSRLAAGVHDSGQTQLVVIWHVLTERAADQHPCDAPPLRESGAGGRAVICAWLPAASYAILALTPKGRREQVVPLCVTWPRLSVSGGDTSHPSSV